MSYILKKEHFKINYIKIERILGDGMKINGRGNTKYSAMIRRDMAEGNFEQYL